MSIMTGYISNSLDVNTTAVRHCHIVILKLFIRVCLMFDCVHGLNYSGAK